MVDFEILLFIIAGIVVLFNKYINYTILAKTKESHRQQMITCIKTNKACMEEKEKEIVKLAEVLKKALRAINIKNKKIHNLYCKVNYYKKIISNYKTND